MNLRAFRIAWLAVLLGYGAIFAGASYSKAQPTSNEHWVTAWTTAPLAETPGKDTPPLLNATLRQVVRVTAAGKAIRVRIGNYFGKEPLALSGAWLNLVDGLAKGGQPQILLFGGKRVVSVPAGEAVVSDPIDCVVKAGADLSVALHIAALPATLTAHPGARATSFVTPGNVLDDKQSAGAPLTCTRWYFLCGVDVQTGSAEALAILGDSITDGYGCPPDSNSRWPDGLARRLQANNATSQVAVLNLGIGGNRLLRDGLGPKAVARMDRDIYGQHGVTCLIIFIGINDIGTRLEARKKGETYASAEDIIGGLQQMATDARRRGLKVIGATITPYAGAGFYWSEDGEKDRQVVNNWIRSRKCFDAVIDFDAILRDPKSPDRLVASFDSGDHLHPSVEGYAQMARAVDLALFAPVPSNTKQPVSGETIP